MVHHSMQCHWHPPLGRNGRLDGMSVIEMARAQQLSRRTRKDDDVIFGHGRLDAI